MLGMIWSFTLFRTFLYVPSFTKNKTVDTLNYFGAGRVNPNPPNQYVSSTLANLHPKIIESAQREMIEILHNAQNRNQFLVTRARQQFRGYVFSEKAPIMDLIKSLIIVSEKAANIARLCRQNQHLFKLLIQKKTDDEANPRFVEDFKTLADVLIQELVKYDIGNRFVKLKGSIQGEENNIFSNQLGETIEVEIKPTMEETATLLQVVLNQDKEAADLLAGEVHREVSLKEVNTVATPLVDFDIDLENLGVWIDPIDSTAEYINGIEEASKNGISNNGLKCVTVLIGAFNKTTGLPILGVVNQPFVTHDGDLWHGECFWGSTIETSLPLEITPTRTICVSTSETSVVVSLLKAKGYEITEAAGAGYKILAVITGLADAYVLTKDSTFKWDTCGPQALLRSVNGDLVVYNQAIKNHVVSVKYTGSESNCNTGGIIAYRKSEVLDEIIECLT